MALRLRLFDQEYGTLLALADAAVPFDREGNRQWLGHRWRFDTERWGRCHYLVEEVGAGAQATAAGEPVGYGAVEQDGAGVNERVALSNVRRSQRGRVVAIARLLHLMAPQ